MEMLRPRLDQPIRLRNATCIYRRTTLSRDKTAEHVVGKNFVPQACLNGQWNLIANACCSCNQEKSSLEDDISAITMQPNVVGVYADDDERLRLDSIRKGKGAISRRTKKRVAEAGETTKFATQLSPNLTFEGSFTGPPQADEDRIFRLAACHIAAFFYYITYDHAMRRGHLWPGGFAPVGWAHRGDWGNTQMRAFEKLICRWHPRMYGVAADEFFCVKVNRAADLSPVWGWALEWNKNYRVIGFIGEEDAVRSVLPLVPPPQVMTIHKAANEIFRMRHDVPLDKSDDRLFDFQEDWTR